jgi:hypothetical protein
METKQKLIRFCILGAVLLALPSAVRADVVLATNNGAISIIPYSCFRGTLIIPSSTNGYPITKSHLINALRV